MANYISQYTGVQIDTGVAKANSAVQPSDLTTALANKQDNLVSGTNIKSLNSATLLGTGNIDINKTTLGLNNVDNTADLAKPISTVTQTALNGKAASVHTHITGDVTGLDTALSGKAASVHNHVTSDVTGLDTALNAKVDKEAGKGLSSSDYTSTEKTKLSGIADNANNYTHPANHPASVITQDENNRFVTDVEKAAWTAKQAALVSGTNIKTVNGTSILGSGDMALGAGAALTYTYTGILDVPIVQLPGASEMVLASPTGKERSYGLLLSRVNTRLTGLDFPNLEFIGSTFNPGYLSALTSLSLPALATAGNGFSPSYMDALTSLNLPALTTVGANFNPTSMAALTSLSLPALTTVGVSFSPSSMAALTSLSLPALTATGTSFNPSSMAALTSLSLPALTTVGGAFSPNNMPALTSLSLPALTATGTSFNPNNMPALTSLSVPVLTTVGAAFNPNNMTALTSLSLPAIERIGTSLASGDVISISAAVGALTSFILPATLKQVGGTGGNVTITSAALNQTSVDSILVRLAALDGTNGTTAFNNRTVTITGTSAAPSATGLAAKATLVARGCTVSHK